MTMWYMILRLSLILPSSLKKNEQVKVYAKLPDWFRIDTPLGAYNPDWAVLLETEGQERLYFVVESKGTLVEELLRDSEQAKIQCGREHFKALGNDARYVVATNVDTFMDQI